MEQRHRLLLEDEERALRLTGGGPGPNTVQILEEAKAGEMVDPTRFPSGSYARAERSQALNIRTAMENARRNSLGEEILQELRLIRKTLENQAAGK